MKWTDILYVTHPHSDRSAEAEILTRLQLQQATSLPPPSSHSSLFFGFYTITRINPLFVDDHDENDTTPATTGVISCGTEIGGCYSSDRDATNQNCHFIRRTVLVTVQQAADGSRSRSQCRRRRRCKANAPRKRRVLSSTLSERYKKTLFVAGAVPYCECDQILLQRLRDGVTDEYWRKASSKGRLSSPSPNVAAVAAARLGEPRCCLRHDHDVRVRDTDDECVANRNSLRSSFSVSTIISSGCSSGDSDGALYSSRSSTCVTSKSLLALSSRSSLSVVDRLAPRPRISSTKLNNAAGAVAFDRLRVQQRPRTSIAVLTGRLGYQLQRCGRTNIVDWHKKSHRTIIAQSSSTRQSTLLSASPSPSPSLNCPQLDYYIYGWPDFTLDIQQAEKVVKNIESRKKQRRWCRIITCCVGFAVLLLSVMLFSMLLTRGEKLFGPL